VRDLLICLRLQVLRTHGDSAPWQPLRRETRATRVLLEETSDIARLTSEVERRLLALVASMEKASPAALALRPSAVEQEKPAAQAKAGGAAQPGRRLNATAG